MRVLLLILLPCLGLPALAGPLADVHTHYKWSQAEQIGPAQVIDTLQAQDVDLAVVIGTPPEYALRLAALDPGRIVPVFGPYHATRRWSNWFKDPALVNDARTALASGRYRGIGELHLIGGFAPAMRDNEVLHGLVQLGIEFQVPLLIHTEYSSAAPFQELCQAYPDAILVWAHAGAILRPPAVRAVLEACPSVVAELSARDPWRFVNNPIADPRTGRLLPEWERLLMDYPQRFMVGSDPVWPVDQLDAWDQPDTGWQELPRFLDFHRRWLAFLPSPARELIGQGNARRLFAASDPR